MTAIIKVVGCWNKFFEDIDFLLSWLFLMGSKLKSLIFYKISKNFVWNYEYEWGMRNDEWWIMNSLATTVHQKEHRHLLRYPDPDYCIGDCRLKSKLDPFSTEPLKVSLRNSQFNSRLFYFSQFHNVFHFQIYIRLSLKTWRLHYIKMVQSIMGQSLIILLSTT